MPAVDCRVSNWAAWSPCSVTCGAGTKARTRHVDEYDRGGGNECPILRTEKYCSPRECGMYFSLLMLKEAKCRELYL